MINEEIIISVSSQDISKQAVKNHIWSKIHGPKGYAINFQEKT